MLITCLAFVFISNFLFFVLKNFHSGTNRVGIEIPKIEVRFENLSIEGDAYVGTRALPTLVNAAMNTVEVLCSVC